MVPQSDRLLTPRACSGPERCVALTCMLMVIFGAGASYGSVMVAAPLQRASSANYELSMRNRPPLTKDLLLPRFGTYAERYNGSGPALVQLQRALDLRPGSGIETVIGELYAQASGDTEIARHVLALRFYLADLIETTADLWWAQHHGITHYAQLLARLGVWRAATREPVALVTFNYDTLLDRSLAQQLAGDWHSPRQLTANSEGADSSWYVDRDDWRLFKLHGSTSWSRVLDGPDAGIGSDPNATIARAARINLTDGPIRDAHWRSDILEAVPAIALPTDAKQRFECPPYHVEAFATNVAQVDRLLIIGWQAAEPHALEVLADVTPGYRLAVVDVDQKCVDTIMQNLGRVAAKSPAPMAFTDSFTGLIQGEALEQWLGLEAPGGW